MVFVSYPGIIVMNIIAKIRKNAGFAEIQICPQMNVFSVYARKTAIWKIKNKKINNDYFERQNN